MLSYMHPQSDAVPWTEVDPDVAATDTATITQRQALHQQPPVSFTPWQPSSWELCPPLPTAAMSMALAITLTHQHVHDMHYLTPRSRYDEVKNYIRQRFHLEQDNPFYIHFKVSQPHPRSPLKYYISSQHDLDQYIRLLYKQHLHIQRHQALPPTSPNTSSAQTSSTITSTTTSSMTMTTTTTTTTSSSQSYSNSLFASAYAHATSTEPQASTSTQIPTHTHIPTQIHTHIPIMTPQPNETESDSDALWYDTNLATLYVTVHSDATSIVPDIHTISQARSLATAQATAKAEQQLLKLLSTIVAPPPDSPDEQEPISWQLVSTSSSTVSTPSSAGPSPSSPTLSTNSNSSSNSSTISVSIPDTLMTPLNPLPSIPLTEAIEQAEQIRKREKIEVEKRRLQAQIEAQKLVIHPESATAEPIAEEFFTILNRMAPTQPSGPHPPIKTDASSRRDEMKTYQSMLQQLEKLNQTCPTPNTQQTIRDTRMHDEDEDEDDDDDEHDSRMEKRRKRHRETDGQRYHKLTALFEQLHQLTKSYAMSQQTGDQDCKESSQTRRSSKPTSLIGKGNLLHEATRMITELEQQRAELEHKLRMKEVQAKHLYRKEVNQHMYAIGLAISLQSSQDSSIYHAIMSAGVITSKYDRNGAMLESSFATINTLGFRPEQVMHRVITDSPMFEQAAPIPFDFLHRRQTTRELAREYLPNWSPAQYYRGNSQIEEEGYGEMEYQQQPSPPQPLPIPWWKQWQTLRQPTPFIIRRKTGRPREYVEIVSLRQVVCDSNGEPQFFLSMSNRRFGIYVSQDQLSG